MGITDTNGRTEYKQARFSSFTKGLQKLADWLAKYDCNDVCMESTGKFWIPVFNILEKTCWVTLAYPKYTKPQKGNKTDHKDAKWICDLYMCDMVNPSFIPPPDIRQLRDLMRYRSKLTNIMTSEKNRALNCLTVSNLKLDDVFSDVFGKSSRSVIRYILEHPGETFQVAPFIDRRCKHPVEEIQAVIDGTISHQQAVKLRECLQHLDELEVSGSAVPLSVGTASDCPRLFRKHYDRHRTDLGNRCRYVGVSFRKASGFMGGLLPSQRPKLQKGQVHSHFPCRCVLEAPVGTGRYPTIYRQCG